MAQDHDRCTDAIAPRRCPLPTQDPRYLSYHDCEWGRPVSDDRKLYEKVCLEGFQAGLSWSTILYRRPAFRLAFSDFDIDAVAAYDERDVSRLMKNPGIIRNRRKITASIHNARRAQALREEFGSLGVFFWSFEPPQDERPVAVTSEWLRENPVTTASTALAKALKTRDWRFVGPTGMYALMQALGMVNDHVQHCCVRDACEKARDRFDRPQL